MIQINLLPDVKLEFLKANRTKRLVTSVSTLVSVGMLSLVGLMAFHVYVNQATHTSALNIDILSSVESLKSIENLDAILTVNEQLADLPLLHEQKPDVTRVSGMLSKIVPSSIDLTELTVDFTEHIISFGGRGTNTKVINTFADILKNTTYNLDNLGGEPLPAFSSVVFDIGIEDKEGVGFDTQMSFSPDIFNNLYSTVTWSIANSSVVDVDENDSVFEDEEVLQ